MKLLRLPFLNGGVLEPENPEIWCGMGVAVIKGVLKEIEILGQKNAYQHHIDKARNGVGYLKRAIDMVNKNPRQSDTLLQVKQIAEDWLRQLPSNVLNAIAYTGSIQHLQSPTIFLSGFDTLSEEEKTQAIHLFGKTGKSQYLPLINATLKGELGEQFRIAALVFIPLFSYTPELEKSLDTILTHPQSATFEPFLQKARDHLATDKLKYVEKQQKIKEQKALEAKTEKLSNNEKVLCNIPLYGFYKYFDWRETHPKKAQEAILRGVGSIIGLLIIFFLFFKR